MKTPNEPDPPMREFVKEHRPGGGWTLYEVNPDGSIDFGSVRIGYDGPLPPLPPGVTFRFDGYATKGPVDDTRPPDDD